MERVQLGSSDIKVSPICVGCWQFNNGAQSADKTWNPQPEQVLADVDAAHMNGMHVPCHAHDD